VHLGIAVIAERVGVTPQCHPAEARDDEWHQAVARVLHDQVRPVRPHGGVDIVGARLRGHHAELAFDTQEGQRVEGSAEPEIERGPEPLVAVGVTWNQGQILQIVLSGEQTQAAVHAELERHR